MNGFVEKRRLRHPAGVALFLERKGARPKAAYGAHTEEHVARADKQLSGVFFGAKARPKDQAPVRYFAATRSG
jgi:hypothetical protein